MGLIKQFGDMWPRNVKNINLIPRSKDGGQGVYALYDGSMSVYIGKGNIHSRISKASKSSSRGEAWDHFSWYVISNREDMHNAEVLLLHVIPWHLRAFNQESGYFRDDHGDVVHGTKFQDPQPKSINHVKVLPKKKKRN